MTMDVRPTLSSPDDDPYLWLEEVEGARALAWVEARNAVTIAASVMSALHPIATP